MKTNYTIKNFRVFGEEGAHIEFAPLTILTGCNSSGKSSIVKSVLLLDSFMKGLKREFEQDHPMNLSANKLDFSQYPSNLLGRYHDVLNDESHDEEIAFSYSSYSYMLGENIEVDLKFQADKNDILDHGHLCSIVVRKDDTMIYSSNGKDGSLVNFNFIRQAFTDFVMIQSCTDNYLSLESNYHFDNLNEDEYQKQIENFKTVIRSFNKERYNDVVNYMRFINNKPIVNLETLKGNIFTNLFKYGWLLYIPVVEELTVLSKDSAITKLEAIISKEDNEDKRKMLHRIIDEFVASDTSDFGKFYTEIETEWLGNIRLHVSNSFINPSKGPNIPSNYCIKISQHHLLNYPKNWSDFTFGENDNSVNVKSKLDEVQEWLNVEKSFELDYSILMRINELNSAPINSDFYKLNSNWYDYSDGYEHFILKFVGQFISDAIKEVLLPNWSNTIGYVSTSRVDIKRLYDLQVDNDFTRLLRSYFENRRAYANYMAEYHNDDKRNYVPDSFMNKWVDKFGIGKAIKLEMDADGAGVKIRLVKYNDKESLLANEGYGITQLMSILLQIECAIQSAKSVKINRAWMQWKLDGYKENEFHYAEQTIAIEEPEIHLHPAYQSLLADMLVEAVNEYNIHFIVETHSEYLIRKLQVLIGANQDKELKIATDKVAIYYIDNKLGKSCSRRIEVCEDGYLDSQFGSGFYDEATKLAKKLI